MTTYLTTFDIALLFGLLIGLILGSMLGFVHGHDRGRISVFDEMRKEPVDPIEAIRVRMRELQAERHVS